MVRLARLFQPVQSLDAKAAKDYMARHREGDYLILDVRQPGEYQEAHLPGARLLPLPELPGAYQTLDPDKPTIVHCAIGGRSRVAAQLLSGLGFKEVYNLAGGIEAYRGPTATGPQEMNLDLVRGDEGPAAVTLLAAGMERALQLFYETLKDRTPDWELLELFGRLARVEESHRQRLLEVYRGLEPDGRELDDKAASTSTLEGGFPFEEFLAANAAFLNAAPRVLDLAMMLETQALDLYLRLARRSANPQAQTILLAIAEEEKGHLASLGQLLAAKAAGG
ncbi:MAG: rhodanese-like domain-containing protein [Desulfobaccales bacterium]